MGQLEQELCPALPWYLPAGQLVHAGALEALYFPAGQLLQLVCRELPWYLPGVQHRPTQSHGRKREREREMKKGEVRTIHHAQTDSSSIN